MVTKAEIAYGLTASSPPSVAEWTAGDLLLHDLCRAVMGANPDEAANRILDEYHQNLKAQFGLGEIDELGYPLLHSRCLDYLPRNIIRSPTRLVAIDLEWDADENLAADFMLYRAVWNDLIGPSSAWASQTIGNFDAFMIRHIRRFYPQYDARRHTENRLRELRFLARVGRSARLSTGKGQGTSFVWSLPRRAVGKLKGALRRATGSK
jgi:hypothetical protein